MGGVAIHGELIPALRLSHPDRLTAAALAERTDRTARQISRIETGRSTTTYEFLDKLSAVLGVEKVADLIVDDRHRGIFLSAHMQRSAR